MVCHNKFPFVDIEPSKTRLQFINDSLDGLLSLLVPNDALIFDTAKGQKCPAARNLLLERVAVGNMSHTDLKACLDLVESTSSSDYKSSSMGWSRAKKRKEMRLPDLRYILLRTSQNGALLGFMSFMLTFEDGLEVVYLYEIHLHDELRGFGFGKHLISIFEMVGRIAETKKAMLTVFKMNVKALIFYENMGYS